MRLGGPGAITRGLILVGAIASCGKDTGGASASRPATEEPATPRSTAEPADEAGDETGEAEPGEPRLELEAEFHRTRIGLGTGIWVLGVVHNQHAERVTDVRVRVRLLDEGEKVVGRADGRVRRSLAADERAGVAVLLAEPIAHESLELVATAIDDTSAPPEPLPLRLTHEPPQRADLGGWYVVGTVENTGSIPIEGARVEIQGLDRSGRLLGIDWLALDPIEPGETIEFDVGDLRYEEPPTKFFVELRPPALE